LTLARNAQKEFLIKVIVGMKFYKTSERKQTSEHKPTCRKQTSFNIQRIYGRRQYGHIRHIADHLWMASSLPCITLFTAKRPFDLTSESEMGFAVKLNLDLIIEYPQSCLIAVVYSFHLFNENSVVNFVSRNDVFLVV